MTTTSVYLLAHRTTLAELKCHFGCRSPVVAIVHAPQGCHCHADPVQALCAQHAVSIDGGPVTPIVDFRKFADTRDLQIALDESLKLQAHYAKLLNLIDGGTRTTFEDSGAWVERLRQTGALT